MYHSRKKKRQGFVILTLTLCLLTCSLFTTVDPVDADALSKYSSFSLEGSTNAPLSHPSTINQPSFDTVLTHHNLEIVAEEMTILVETLKEARTEVETILEEERKKAEEEARKKAEKEARKKAEEEARKKAEEETQKNQQNSSQQPSEDNSRREINYTVREVNGYSELEYLAAICFIEAGNNYDGSLAVANVVLNRLLSSRFPNTIYDVIYQKNQFATRRMASTLEKIHNGSYTRCLQAAKDALAGVNNIGNRVSFRGNNTMSSSQLSGLDHVVIGGNTFF